MDAFWDGGRTWRARFSPDRPGEWRWRSQCAQDGGLDGREGGFRCVPYAGDNPVYLGAGPVQVSADRRSSVHADGTPFFWLGDTAWNGAIRSEPQDWDLYLRTRREQGFSAVQFVTTQWRACSRDAHGEVAYVDGERIGLNPRWFQRLDPRFDAINAHGLVAAPVVLWACVDGDPGRTLSVANATRLARYICARPGALQVVWLLAGDGEYSGATAQRWHQIAAEALPATQKRLTTLHFCGQSWPMDDFRDAEWLDFIGYQSGHGSSAKHVRWLVQGPPSQAWLKVPARPIINLEPNYEGHPSSPRAAPLRRPLRAPRLLRSLLIAPTAGVTYGNNCIWLWSTRTEIPEGHEGPRPGRPMARGAGDARHAQHRAPAALLRRHALVDAAPGARAAVRPARGAGSEPLRRPAARTEDGGLAVLYTPQGGTLPLHTALLRRPATACWFDPREGRCGEPIPVSGARQDFATPDERDWVLCIRSSE